MIDIISVHSKSRRF